MKYWDWNEGGKIIMISSASNFKYINDPIERLIDRQLASIWRPHQLQKKQDRSRGMKVKEYFPARNKLEDEMLYALDCKYFGSSRSDEMLVYYLAEGVYTQEDIAKIIGRSQSFVSKRSHVLSCGYLSGGIYEIS